MKARDLMLVVRRNLGRRKLRTVLTISGVALSVALFVSIESFAAGMDAAIESGDRARTLVVYRKNRYCPQTSHLPERYVDEIASVPGVDSVLPVKVYLNNCRTNLDMITFHGAPVDAILATRGIDVIDGDVEVFRRDGDAALVGVVFARRRGLSVGDKFRFGDIVVRVAGIFRSDDPVQEALVLTHLEFLQRAGGVNRLGTVTQFDVRIHEASRAKEIADEIDRRLATLEEPTDTRPMSAFLERATGDLREILRFGRVFGVACVLVMLVLVANTIYMSVQERRREMGALLTIGFRAPHLTAMVMGESLALGLAGGVLGLAAAFIMIKTTGIAVGVEGIQVGFRVSAGVVAMALGAVLGSSAISGAIPAVRLARLDPVLALRSLT